MSTHDDVKNLIAYLQGAFPHCALAKLPLRKLKLTVDVWLDLLHDLPIDAIMSAARELSDEDREFPANPGQIRQRAFDYLEGDDGPPSAEEAWGEVKKAFSLPAAWINWSHPLIQTTVEGMGGLRGPGSMGSEPIEMAASLRMRFIQYYDILAKRDKSDRRMLPQVREAIAELAEKKRLRLGEGDAGL